jgi:hypothetical protein
MIALSLFLAACQQRASPPAASSPGAAPIATPARILSPAVKPADALASHNTNWSGVVADVTEFRRKGNILTALVRLRNTKTGGHTIVQFGIGNVYLMDAAGAKKYEVLKDEKGGYIASSTGLLTEDVGGEGITVWMKFPAPPLETKTATLAMPEMPPFEDLPIQDQ